ncbi:MAG: secretin N-terminal domain-containing protein [Candidatus Omnitrophica bacterium]|nr:secretin N-terminal domain-containing protein [Candidatus Omnitrophota bacterium]
MKRLAVFLSVLTVFACGGLRAEELAPAMLAASAQPAITPLSKGIDSLISLDLRMIDINDALKYFSLKSGLNIVTTKSVTGRVTLIVEDVPVKDVLDIMLRSNGLAYDKVGNIYNVMTQEEYKQLYGQKFADVREVKIFRLNYAIPDQAFSLLDAVKSEVGRILVDPESGSVLCMDSPEKIRQMEKVLKEFEQQNVTRVFPLNYAKAKVVEEQLMTRLDAKKVGSIKADERANQVIVQAFPERMKEIEELIAALDKKTKQILLEAKIVKVKIADGTEVGIEWEGLFEASGKNGNLTYVGSTPFAAVQSTTADWRSRAQVYEDVGNVGSYAFSGTTSNYSSSTSNIGIDQLHIGFIGSNDFDVLLTYLNTLSETKILSSPKIAVTNNQEARIHVGERQAYVTTTTTTGSSTSTVSEQVNFIDIGIQLDVVPRISEDGFIDIKLKTEVSSVVKILVTPSENQIPIVDTSLAETSVLVKDGCTVVIGGLRKDEETKTEKRVPILSKIPVLGKLFQKTSSSTERTELLILITPTIISGEALIANGGAPIGDANIKPPQDYGEVEKIKEDQKTHMPPPPEAGFGGMEMKGFKVYKGSGSDD